MFTIGEFSKVTGLTVKTLRFYHEEGLLAPAYVDPQTGYRHYDERQAEAARAIAFLRSLEFPVAKIRELLQGSGDDQSLLDAVERHRASIAARSSISAECRVHLKSSSHRKGRLRPWRRTRSTWRRRCWSRRLSPASA